jgi:E3 ubiquitin-protein ligase SHPRH
MEQLLEQMLKKTALECEDVQRALVSSLNGLAGIDIINELWEEAAEKYREVFRIEVEMRDKIKMDILQVF